MKFRMQKFEYENKSLLDEKELLVHQIKGLESYNKN